MTSQGKDKTYAYVHQAHGGFMETAQFDVEGLLENEIRLTYDDKDGKLDERYDILIPGRTGGGTT